MRIDLTPLITGKTQMIPFEFSLELDPGSIFEQLTPVESRPVQGSGKVFKAGRRLMLELSYAGAVTLACDRCLEPFEHRYSGKLERPLEKGAQDQPLSDDEEVEDIWYIDGDEVDIDAVVQDDIILNLPIQMICSPDCKGLCKACGHNLNTGPCSCEPDTVDPRLASLKEFLNRA